MESSPHLINSNSAIYSGCGNLFILTFLPELSARCVELCQANGTDGLIVLEDTPAANFKVRIFNRDGSEAEMCGNGLRCAVQFFIDRFHSQQKSFTIETMHERRQVVVRGGEIAVDFPMPKTIEEIEILGLKGYFLNTGVPHAVFFVQNLEDPDLFRPAPEIRRRYDTNVNFALLGNPLAIRTYERGVEGETQSCGTGCVAAAFAAYSRHGLKAPIILMPRSKEALTVSIEGDKITLSGPARLVSVDIYDIIRYNSAITTE